MGEDSRTSKQLESTKYVDFTNSRLLVLTLLNMYQTEDYLLVLSDGKTFQGVDAVWKAAPAVFEPFSAYKHFPVLMVVWQEKGSWVVFGFAHWFFNLQAPLPENVTDPDGGKWVGVANLGFKFGFAQKGDEIKMNETRLFTDPSPALRLLLQNKLVDGEGVAKIIMTG